LTIDEHNNLYVVWSGGLINRPNIYFSRSVDGGSSWETAKKVYNSNQESVYPCIAVDQNGNMSVLWKEGYGFKKPLYFFRSTDFGKTWTEPINLARSKDRVFYPDMAGDPDGNVFVVWGNGEAGKIEKEVYFRRYSKVSSSWSSIRNISKSSGQSFWPDVAIDNAGNINLVWTEEDGLYFSRSIDKGKNWSQPLHFYQTDTESSHAEIEIDRLGNPYIFWQEGSSSNTKIYFCKSNN
jgi:hypothetical protein